MLAGTLLEGESMLLLDGFAAEYFLGNLPHYEGVLLLILAVGSLAYWWCGRRSKT